MNDKVKDTLMLPVAIPTWGLACGILSIVFSGGVIMNKLDTLVENGHKYERKVDILFERQVMNIANVAHLQTELAGIKSRLAEVERK